MQEKLTRIPGLMLLGALSVVAAEKPASDNLTAPWEPCVKALGAAAYDTQATGHLAGTTDRLYIMYYGPQGYFDRRGCDIRAAVYTGGLMDLQSK
jgi:hypothetical protein